MFQHDMREAAAFLDITLTDQQIDLFFHFEAMLLETNTVMNLTAITDPREIAIKHMADSLSCYDERYFPKNAEVLDLGTGAGFPGVPLAILRPDLKITFFDSLQKRLTFLRSVASELQLSHVSFLHGRAEDEGHLPKYRERFSIVTSRAVARMNVLAEWALPYVRIGGVFIALKGARYAEELQEARSAIQVLGGTVVHVEPVRLWGLEDKRAVLYIEKNTPSPNKYPRKPKIANKNPL